MIDIYADEYWLIEFTITVADLDRFAELIQKENIVFDSTSLVKLLVKRRLEFGHEVSPTVLKSWTGKDAVRIWDPLKKWSVGDGIIVPRDIEGDNYECFVGHIISVDKVKPNHIEIRLDSQGTPIVFRYGNPTATEVGEFSRSLVEKKYGDVEYIVRSFGSRIVSALLHALEKDERFVGLEGKWYLVQKLPLIETGLLKSLYRNLLKRDTFILDDVLSMVKEDAAQNEIFSKMAIQVGLRSLPERFENTSSSSHPIWRALPPRPEKAKVTHHAYDTKSYEILCSPGQQLETEKVQRLMELNLYKFITTFMDEE